MSFRRAFSVWVLGVGSLVGCFTEVGNPDDPIETSVLSTQFTLDYTTYPVAISKKSAAGNVPHEILINQLSLATYDAEYFHKGLKYYLQEANHTDWNNRYSHYIDFTGKDKSKNLPVLHADSLDWDLFYFTIRTDTPVTVVPNPMVFSQATGPRFMTGTVTTKAGDIDFLFEIPIVRRIFLIFGDATLQKLRTPKGYNLDIAFRAQYFHEAIPWDSVVTTTDTEGKTYALLNSKVNPQFYTRLTNGFVQAFAVDTSRIDGAFPLP